MQSIIESRVEKRTKGVYVPFGGKSMITFMDDLNMPAKDLFGSQPPLELIRLWIDYGFWYDRMKQSIKHIRVSAPPPLDPRATWSHLYIPPYRRVCSSFLRPQRSGSQVPDPIVNSSQRACLCLVT